ncbi:hypothetical protein J14TS2_39480 [Bacillus sp. J14TS2]|nr:hypothetical protein J14TS2_39480 [Bacillus sp. J14TS2]
MNKAIRLLKGKQTEIERLGIHYTEFIKILNESEQNMIRQCPYKAINFPIKDKKLHILCHFQCRKQGSSWGNPDINTPVQILRKHNWRRLPNNIGKKNINSV